MSIGLSYNNDLSRVQIALSDLPDGTVRMERSPSGLLWETVRAGDELEVSAGAASLDDFEFYADRLNHYRAVPIDPPAGLLLPGDSGDYASTPDTAALDITGDIFVAAYVRPEDITPGADSYIVSKFATTGNQRSWRFILRTTGLLSFGWSPDGTADILVNSTSAPTWPAEGQAVAAELDVNDGAGNRIVRFLTGPTLAGPWTQLGSPVVTAGVTSIFAGSAPVEVGAVNGGTSPLGGAIDAAEIRSGNRAGTIVADPNFAAQTGGAGSFTDDAGLLWTINGDAEIVGIQSDTITPDLLGEVWLKSIRYPLLNRPVLVQTWTPGSRPFRGTIDEVQGRSLPSSTSDLRGSKRFEMVIATRDIIDQTHDGVAEAGALDVIFSVETDFFIHVPASRSIPGGHVAIVADLDEDRIVPKGDRAPRAFRLQCTRVAAPDADVVPTTLVIGTILNQFGGDIAAVLAAHPTLRDLLAVVGSPDDLVVI